jgi:excinuclease ABC subunit B
LRLEIEEDKIAKIQLFDKKNYTLVSNLDNIIIFPAKHFVMPKNRLERAIATINTDLQKRLAEIEDPVVGARLKNRITHDISMLRATGYCEGIENYSSYFDNRSNRPFCLLDFYKKGFLFIIDESHIATPQLQAMYRGDQSRKKNLVDYGFRLPSAMDNRPLRFEEIEEKFQNTIFVSATPGNYEKQNASVIAEQIIRPTGVLDPKILVHGREGQLDNLLQNIKETSRKDFRTLITVLTKKFAEELALFLEGKGIAVCYLHSDIKTPQRSEILDKLQSGVFEAVVGINLLREGLDLPNVALLAIMDADIQGFLRDERSLIQTIGRAARNTESKVILYADKITDSMKMAMQETERRRNTQIMYNEKHNITPVTAMRQLGKEGRPTFAGNQVVVKPKPNRGTEEHRTQSLEKLQKQMMQAAKNRDFERAIELREIIKKIQKN